MTDFEKNIIPLKSYLYQCASQFVKDNDDKEDLIQKTLILAYKSWHKYNDKYLKSWLSTILKNQALNFYKSKHNKTESFDEVAFDYSHDYYSKKHITLNTSPDYILNNKYIMNRIEEAFEQLPQKYYLPTYLIIMKQTSYNEAATILEIPVGTVKSLVSRGRSYLKDYLRDLGMQYGYSIK